jgi:tetratricopeptide (TPR) repeat protein
MYPEAARLFRSASKIKGDFHEAWFYLSQTELALKNAEEAIQAGSRAVELRPNFADYRNNLGEAYLASKLCRDAVREFNEAIKGNVYYADAYFNLGVTYVLNAINKEDYEMADDYAPRTRDLLNKASLIYPFYKTSDFNAALTALANDDPASAHSMLTRVREDIKEKHRLEKASYIHRFLMSTDWINKENIDDRISILEREIDKNPGYVDLYYDMAICQLHRAKFGWEEAIDSFMKALNINPELKKAQRALDLARDQFLKIADSIVDITSRKS